MSNCNECIHSEICYNWYSSEISGNFDEMIEDWGTECRLFFKEIVHCKDCKHALFNPRIKEGFCVCELTKTVPLNHYCGWGIKLEKIGV